MAIQINTALVLDAAAAISNENSSIRSGYDEIDKAVANIKRNWSGSACDVCCKKADYIKSQYKDNRFQVVDNFVRFLKLQVGEGYDVAETVISSAAGAFK